MKNTINLLSFTAAPLSFWEKFYVWALTVGRYIIIITELIVLLAFFYKFKVDNDLSAVKTDIDKNVGIMKANHTQAVTIKNYEDRIGNQSFLMAAQLNPQDIYAHTLSLIPSPVSILSLDLVTKKNLQIDGIITGTSQTQLNTIQDTANAFKADTAYTNVALSNVTSSSQTGATTFTITMDLSQPQVQQ